MAKKKNKGFMRAAWQFAISIRLAILLLFLLSVACIIGTVVPQKANPQEYLKVYSQSTYEFFKTVGFDDLYSSLWFRWLLGVFTFNLIGCTIQKLPRVMRLMFKTKKTLDEEMLRGLTIVKKFTSKEFGEDRLGAVRSELEKLLGKATQTTLDGQRHLFAERGRISRLGPTVTHLGLVVIFAGGLMSWLGFQGFVQIYEGQTADTVYLRDKSGTVKLDFQIRCDDFDLTYYDKTRRPKDYKSTLTVIENGREVLTKVVEVNVPLVYKGIYFYQSSYGSNPRAGGEVTLRVRKEGEAQGKVYRAAVGKSFAVEGTGDTVWVDSFLPDFSMNQNGRPFSKTEALRNPAAFLRVERNGEVVSQSWVFAKFPDFHKKKTGDYEFLLEQFQPLEYTGLQATRDPGVWVVWAGCALLLLGIYVAFFCYHRRIWIRVQEREGVYTATLAGSANKNRILFKRDFEKLFKNIKD